MKKVLYVLSFLLTIGVIDAFAPSSSGLGCLSVSNALAQSSPPLSPKRIRLQGQAAPPTPNPPTGYYNIWVDSATGALNITDSAGTDTPVGAGISGLTDNVIPQANGTTAIENSKMTASGGSSGTWTLYDSGGTGISAFNIRAGASQSTNALATFFANDGTTARFTFAHNGVLTATVATDNVLALNAGRTGAANAVSLGDKGFGAGGQIDLYAGGSNTFQMTGGLGLEIGSGLTFLWSASGTITGGRDLGLARSAAGILAVTDGSTGSGGIGISDTATATVTDALILRHATTDAGFGQDGFGTGLLFQGEDEAGNMNSMAQIQAVYTDSANGSEDTKFVLRTTVAGVDTEALVFSVDQVAGNSLTLNAADSVTNLNFATAGTTRWYVRGNSEGHLYPNADKTYNFGHPTLQIKDSYLSTSIQGTRTQAISDNAAAATFVTIAAATSNTVVGGRIFYTITAIDAGTGSHVKTGTYSFGLNNVGGTVTGTGTDVLEHSAASAGGGTLAPTFSINISGTNAQFQLVLDTSLDAAAETLKIEYRVQIDSGTATVTPAT